MNHLDLLQLDLIRTGEADAEDVTHFEGCAVCLEALEQLTHFAQQVQDLEEPAIAIPDGTDNDVRQSAKRAAARIRDRGHFVRWSIGAAAAVLLSILGLWHTSRQLGKASTPTPAVAIQVGDIDGDGIVDIVDALVLAGNLKSQSVLNAAWDVNGDGKIDRGDVDVIAKRVVRIKGSEG